MRTIPARALQYIADISDRKTVHSQQPYYSEDEATENETIENDIVQTVTTLKSGTEKTAEATNSKKGNCAENSYAKTGGSV